MSLSRTWQGLRMVGARKSFSGKTPSVPVFLRDLHAFSTQRRSGARCRYQRPVSVTFERSPTQSSCSYSTDRRQAVPGSTKHDHEATPSPQQRSPALVSTAHSTTQAEEEVQEGVRDLQQPPWNVFFTKQYWREVRDFLSGMPNPPHVKTIQFSKFTSAQHRAVWTAAIKEYAESWKNVRGGDSKSDAGKPTAESVQAEIDETMEKVRKASSKVGDTMEKNVKHNIDYLRSNKDKELNELKAFAEDKMDMYREALQSFLEGYREGKEAPQNVGDMDFSKFVDEAMSKGREAARAAVEKMNAERAGTTVSPSDVDKSTHGAAEHHKTDTSKKKKKKREKQKSRK